MSKKFDRDKMAKWYATQHLKTDVGVVSVHYLPKNADEKEIRFIEVNCMIAEWRADGIPLDFGVDADTKNGHRLIVLDVTPDQWKNLTFKMPNGWTLEEESVFK